MARPRKEITAEEMAERKKVYMKRFYEKLQKDPERLAHYREMQNIRQKEFWAKNPDKYNKYCIGKTSK